jgi:hypothetical protein
VVAAALIPADFGTTALVTSLRQPNDKCLI